MGSLIRPRNYDVFLSFRGEDTRTGFTSHLYDALTRHGINTFRDDENLRVGDLIRPELLEAIAASRFGIVVLSRGYADSTWCLEEKTELIVIPVFYHVDPSDVRYQRKTFGEAFAKHETSNRFPPENVETWRAALTTVGDIRGLHVHGTGYETEVISEIVRRISKDLQNTLPRDATKGLVGIECRIEELKSLLDMESNDVRFIGICGMSGMGKTTLAEVVYQGIRNQFQGYCFIENIKDISRQNDSRLCELQQKILVDILKDKHIRVRSVIEGVSMLQDRLCGLKIIIVLDDVNHQHQLEFLAREREWFGHGSRIIMTTTNEDLLIVHRVDGRYKCEGLTLSDATRLFNLKAFAEGQPKQGYEKLSSDVVKLAGGLPLALDVFGCLLFGKEEEYWRDTLEKLQQFPEEKILQRLEICYDRLDRNEKEIFIYIACFLKGRDEVLVKDILKDIGKHPVRGIDILKNRSLITINYDDSVWMHDLLQQMGWEVLRKKFPEQPGKRVGLKCREDIVAICKCEEKETNAIEIINQEHYGAEVENFIADVESFSKMKKLKFLRISNVDFSNGLEYLSNDLRILEWYGCSLKSFPPTFAPKQIYELDMRSSQLVKLWEKNIDLPNLRSINLCDSGHLTKIPDLTSTPKLWKLNLEGCTNLVDLHKSLLSHKRLSYVNLKGCKNLRSLGNKMEMDSLESLLLSGCSKLEHIPEFGENMKRLEDLYLDGTKIKRLPESLGKMCSLRKLDVSETAIEEWPSFILHLERFRLLRIHGCRLLSLTRTFHSMELSSLGLKELDLSACNLSAIPDYIGLLYSLKELDLSENDFVTLPASISLLSNLRMLCLNGCTRLESLPLLSKINEVTVYGGEIRYSHYILGEGLDVSKFRMSSHSDNPTVSCLDCPKLIENQSGSGLANTILKKYLQGGTRNRGIPEAVFEIVGAGSEIPERGVKLRRSHPTIHGKDHGLRDVNFRDHGLWGVNFRDHGLRDVNFKDDGLWDVSFDGCIGVALCTVIVVPHPLDNMRGACIEVKHEVVARNLHVVGKYWRIPVPIYFLEGILENQWPQYLSVTHNFQREYPSQENQFKLSFSVEPEDGNLEDKKFRVRFQHPENVWKLRGHRVSIHGIPSIGRMISLFRCQKQRMRWYKEVCEANQELQSLNLSFQDHTCKVINILTGGFKDGSISLDSIREVIESLLEKNQEVVKVILECKEEILKDWTLHYFVRHFFKMSTRMLELCTDFLEGIGASWLIVQLAMQQIEAKRRAGTLNFSETVQHLIDLEAPMVPLSVNFNALFGNISENWDYAVQKIHDTKSPSVKACKVSLVTTAATLSTVLISAVVALRSAVEKIRDTKSPSVKARKVSLVTTAATLSEVLISAVVALRSALSPTASETKKFVHGMRTLFEEWLAGHEYKSWDEGFKEYETSEDGYFNLRITDFDGILELLEELKSRMEWLLQLSDSIAKKDEEGKIVILMDGIKMRISEFTNTIEHMSKHAWECIRYLRQAATALNSDFEVKSHKAQKR